MVQHERAFVTPKLIICRSLEYLVSTSIEQIEELWIVFGSDSLAYTTAQGALDLTVLRYTVEQGA